MQRKTRSCGHLSWTQAPQPLLPVAPGASRDERLELYAPPPQLTPVLWCFQPRGMQFFSFIKKLTGRVFDSFGKSMNTEY